MVRAELTLRDGTKEEVFDYTDLVLTDAGVKSDPSDVKSIYVYEGALEEFDIELCESLEYVEFTENVEITSGVFLPPSGLPSGRYVVYNLPVSIDTLHCNPYCIIMNMESLLESGVEINMG